MGLVEFSIAVVVSLGCTRENPRRFFRDSKPGRSVAAAGRHEDGRCGS